MRVHRKWDLTDRLSLRWHNEPSRRDDGPCEERLLGNRLFTASPWNKRCFVLPRVLELYGFTRTGFYGKGIRIYSQRTFSWKSLCRLNPSFLAITWHISFVNQPCVAIICHVDWFRFIVLHDICSLAWQAPYGSQKAFWFFDLAHQFLALQTSKNSSKWKNSTRNSWRVVFR